MFERLTDGLSKALGNVGGKRGEQAREAFISTVRDRLLEADVHPELVAALGERLDNRLARPSTDSSLPASRRYLNELEDEIRYLLGQKPEPLRLPDSQLGVVMMVGLQGTGKTTTCGKLADYLQRQGKRVLLVPLDLSRPAAIEQLEIVGETVGADVWATPKQGAKPVKAAQQARKDAEKQGYDVVIFDTAGRLSIDREALDEVRELRKKLRPQEVLYVLDAMAGQTAVSTAEAFAEAGSPSGIVLTKVDADARGGAVLSVRARTQLPVKFMGVGERPGDFEPFDPERIINRLLDLGDLDTLASKFDATVDQDEAEALSKKMLSAKFNLEDFAKQIEMLNKLGAFGDMLKMLPGGKGLAKQMKNLDMAEDELRRTLAIIRSMTPQERRNPRLLSGRRKVRVARGSGVAISEVNRLLKRYQRMQKMMKQLKKMPMGNLEQMLSGGGGALPGGRNPFGGGGLS